MAEHHTGAAAPQPKVEQGTRTPTPPEATTKIAGRNAADVVATLHAHPLLPTPVRRRHPSFSPASPAYSCMRFPVLPSCAQLPHGSPYGILPLVSWSPDAIALPPIFYSLSYHSYLLYGAKAPPFLLPRVAGLPVHALPPTPFLCPAPSRLTIRHITTRVVVARCDSFAPYILFAFPPLLPPLMLPHPTPLSLLLLPPLGTVVLATSVTTSSPDSRVPLPSSALGAMLPHLAMLVNLGSRLDYPSPLPYPTSLTPLTSSIVTFRHPRYRAFPITSTIWSSWMTSLTTCGRFLNVVSLTPSPPYLTSSCGC
jgi:hypothetical protein